MNIPAVALLLLGLLNSARASINELLPDIYPAFNKDYAGLTVGQIKQKFAALEGGSASRQERAAWLCQLGVKQSSTGLLDAALNNLRLCAEHYQKSQHHQQLAKALAFTANVYFKKGYYFSARTSNQMALATLSQGNVTRPLVEKLHYQTALIDFALHRFNFAQQQSNLLLSSEDLLMSDALVIKVILLKALIASTKEQSVATMKFLLQAEQSASDPKLKLIAQLWYLYELVYQGRTDDKQRFFLAKDQKDIFLLGNTLAMLSQAKVSVDKEAKLQISPLSIVVFSDAAFLEWTDRVLSYYHGLDDDQSRTLEEDLDLLKRFQQQLSTMLDTLSLDLQNRNQLRYWASLSNLDSLTERGFRIRATFSIVVVLLMLLTISLLFAKRRQASRHKVQLGKKKQQLDQHARFDALTRAANRDWASQLLTHEIQMKHQVGSQVLLMLVDIDNFREFNSRYGHQTGDEALSLVASKIKRCIRQQDFCARWGADEFLLYLPDTDNEGYTQVANKLRHAFSQFALQKATTMRQLTLSVSVVSLESEETLTEAVKRLEDGIFQSMTLGGANLVFN